MFAVYHRILVVSGQGRPGASCAWMAAIHAGMTLALLLVFLHWREAALPPFKVKRFKVPRFLYF
jgi:hypothetical protein